MDEIATVGLKREDLSEPVKTLWRIEVNLKSRAANSLKQKEGRMKGREDIK